MFGELIPVVAILSSVAFAWFALRFYQLRQETRVMEGRAALQRKEKERLENRLAVLERIVTDRGIQTAEQIEALRGSELAANIQTVQEKA